jgi:cysteinyl-tRNA synthetase
VRPFQIYDTLAGAVRPFEPRVPPRVGLFVCGLTPYAETHVGHARTFVTFDVVARALRRWGYHVIYVQNVTNLDDKIIDRAKETRRDPLELADYFFKSWLRSAELLDIRSVNLYPYATDYIPEIIDQTTELIRRGSAYEAAGDVFFEVARFPDYGKLSGQRVEALRPGARVEVDPKKRAPEDFAIWKAAKPGEPAWPSPWSSGRPGWHIEDTAITGRLLGPRYDIHGGGADLKFPHHEAEIALAESASGLKPLANYWMHGGILQMRGEKMAKSVGNVVAVDEAVRSYGAETVRFFLLNAHYRSPLNFEEGKSLEEARQAYDTLAGPYRRLQEELHHGGLERAGREPPPELARIATELPETFDRLLADDFNTREVLAAFFRWSRTLSDWTSKLEALSGTALVTLGAPYRWGAEVLGLFLDRAGPRVPAHLADLVRVALDARARARTRGDFAEADRIREELLNSGIAIEDQGATTRWRWRPEGAR